MDQLEHHLRQTLVDDAANAPSADGLAAAATEIAGRRRRVRAWSTAALAVVATAGLAATFITLSSDPSEHRRSALRGAVAIGGDCAAQYSTTTLQTMPIAFDGTVSSIGSERSYDGVSELPLISVTFAVREWFRGGTTSTIAVEMSPPDAAASVNDNASTAYGVGTRMLVSGVPKATSPSGDTTVAWGCGFTRYYDESTASLWRTSFGR